MTKAWLVGCVAWFACRDRAEPAAAPPPAIPSQARDAPASPALALGAFELRAASARYEDRQLVVRLSDAPGPCGPSLDAPWHAVLSIEVPPGPAGAFYAGSPIGVRAFGLDGNGARVELAPADTIAQLAPFAAQVGAHVRGTIDTPRGSGAFDATLCALDAAPEPLPETAPDAPASGQLDGHAFVARRGLIWLAGDGATLDELRLFTEATVTCRDFDRPAPALDFTRIGGTGARHPLIGTPQPAWAAVTSLPVARGYATGRVPAWLRFDQLAFTPGAKITGSVVAAQPPSREPTTAIAGRFEAEVCAAR